MGFPQKASERGNNGVQNLEWGLVKWSCTRRKGCWSVSTLYTKIAVNFKSLVFFLPCAVINFPIWWYFYPHVLTCNVMVFCIFDIPEVCVWGPEQFSRICRYVKRHTVVVFKSWISPPLAHKYVHRVFLETRKQASWTAAKEIAGVEREHSLIRWVLYFTASLPCRVPSLVSEQPARLAMEPLCMHGITIFLVTSDITGFVKHSSHLRRERRNRNFKRVTTKYESIWCKQNTSLSFRWISRVNWNF